VPAAVELLLLPGGRALKDHDTHAMFLDPMVLLLAHSHQPSDLNH
jgi:hypothetical protein